MPKYYCEYCGIYLTHSSPSGRGQHGKGRKHQVNRQEYYKMAIEEQKESFLPLTETGINLQNVLMGGMPGQGVPQVNLNIPVSQTMQTGAPHGAMVQQGGPPAFPPMNFGGLLPPPNMMGGLPPPGNLAPPGGLPPPNFAGLPPPNTNNQNQEGGLKFQGDMPNFSQGVPPPSMPKGMMPPPNLPLLNQRPPAPLNAADSQGMHSSRMQQINNTLPPPPR